jgi:hypothetical protein
MLLSRDSSITVVDRIQRDPAFAIGLLDEAVSLFLNGEPDVARLVLRDLVNGTIGFEGLAMVSDRP